ncbi:hypothetical protein CEXT_178371 [Caerostris extrusa]|uniref:Uncharacterized protein n=1 Tax=Caerostris extrusa TaxID=172846 RepID=A0AAV4QPI8_CAEEX|nr:hypothetical protein CEXT_178371 [Caerostris extrusa]
MTAIHEGWTFRTLPFINLTVHHQFTTSVAKFLNLDCKFEFCPTMNIELHAKLATETLEHGNLANCHTLRGSPYTPSPLGGAIRNHRFFAAALLLRLRVMKGCRGITPGPSAAPPFVMLSQRIKIKGTAALLPTLDC